MNTGNQGRFSAVPAAPLLHGCLLLLLAMGLASCASAPSVADAPTAANTVSAEAPGSVMGLLGSLSDKALEITGIKAPAKVPESLPDSALPDRRIRWQLHASASLNVTDTGQPLSLVTRIYKLRSPDSFLQAPMDVFGDPAREKQALGDDLVAVREVQLVPGQRREAIDKVARDVSHVGIVALYRKPAAGRWRYAFKAADAELSGLTLGAHACALSVQLGTPLGTTAGAARSAAVSCP